MGEWEQCDLEKIATVQTGPFGSQLKNEQYIIGGTPVVTVEHVKDFRILDFTYPSVTDNDRDRLDRYHLNRGDIVFTRVGSVDLSAFIAPHQDGWLFSSRMLRVRVKEDEICSRFLSYYFQKPSFREYIKTIAVGATMPSINTEILSKVPISYPPLHEQKAIAEVLSSLDDKIDLLHRQNKTLEALAETLFRQMFVENAQDDWVEGTLGDIIEFNPQLSLVKGEPAPYLEMANVSTNSPLPSYWYNRDYTSGMRFQNGDTLLARITPCLQNGKTCFVQFLERDEVGWGSTEFIVMRMKEGYHPFLSYLWAKDNYFREFAISVMSGSSGRQRAQADDLKYYQILKPSSVAIEAVNSLCDNTTPKLAQNFHQIIKLEKLRDTLLPKLMSGEVRVEYEGA